jgi:hypothetical protein
MSSLLKITVPSDGGRNPESRLNSVVFPEPLGPMIPEILFSSIAIFTQLTATNPSNRLVRLLVSIIALILHTFNCFEKVRSGVM